MIKKIVHIADIHIRTFRFHDEYKEVMLTFINDLREKLKSFSRDEVRIAIVGDLVHQKIVISNEQLLLCHWFLSELEQIAPLVIIAGNHDLLENNKSRLDSISPIVQFMDGKLVNYFKESKCFSDDNIVWCVYSIFEDNKKPDIKSARAKRPDSTFIGLFHAPLIGSKTNAGFEFEHGTKAEVFEGCDFVLLGDIHMFQEFEYNGIKAVYPSSMIQQNFGESVSNHGYLIWDVESKSYEKFELPNENAFCVFKITSIKQLEDGEEEFVNK